MKSIIKCNDNLVELKKIPDESVDLVYIDPPFFTQKDWKDFDDRWNSIDGYLEFMKSRLKEVHRILKPTGSLYLHADQNADSYLRVNLDEIFGMKNFRSMIRWKRVKAKNGVKNKYPSNSDTILYYTKGPVFTFNTQFRSLSEKHVKNKYTNNDMDGKGLYYKSPVDAPDGRYFSLGLGEKIPGRGYGPTKKTLLKWKDEGILWIEPGKIPYKKIYLKERPGVPVDDIWDDITMVGKGSKELIGYATQKPEKLLERIIKTSSNEGDVIIDAFAGSGTTCAVAQKLGRKSICIDQNPKACKIMEERLH